MRGSSTPFFFEKTKIQGDAVAPPEKQAAVYRAVHGPVKHLLYPKYIHERINAYGDQLLAFLHPDAQIDC